MNAQQLKNSILQEAIEGRLVPQDPNDEPASVLLDKIRKEKARLVKENLIYKKSETKPLYEEGNYPFEIPNNWKWVQLSDVSIIQEGAGIRKHQYTKEGIQLLCVTNILDGLVDLSKKVLYVSDKEYKEKYQHLTPQRGDIVTACSGGSWGKIAIFDCKDLVMLNTSTLRLRFFNDLANNKYLYHLAQSKFFKDQLACQLVGIQPNFGYAHYSRICFPLPPLAEQKRIVAKIEELLPKVEAYGKAQESLDKLNEELPERLKKSILQEAIEGRLVPQDPNDEPASVLLDKIRKEKARLVKEGKLKKKDLVEVPIKEDEIPFKIPESWEWCKLGTIAALIGGFAFKSHEYTSSGSRVIRISDITENGFINKNVVRFPFTDKLSQYVILEGDILMAMTGGTVGKSLYVKYLPEETMLLNQRVALIRPNIVFTDYIDYVIKSQHIQGIITEAKNSTNDNISMGDLYNFPIPLPPLSEQKRIVAKIEELMHEIDKLKV